MIRVSVEVCSGAARFRASVWAKSIEGALNLVGGQYPNGEAKVIFPIEPEPFFVGVNSSAPEAIRLEKLEEAAG